jgi:hypothetical protein
MDKQAKAEMVAKVTRLWEYVQGLFGQEITALVVEPRLVHAFIHGDTEMHLGLRDRQDYFEEYRQCQHVWWEANETPWADGDAAVWMLVVHEFAHVLAARDRSFQPTTTREIHSRPFQQALAQIIARFPLALAEALLADAPVTVSWTMTLPGTERPFTQTLSFPFYTDARPLLLGLWNGPAQPTVAVA